jgi:hypothetical protein
MKTFLLVLFALVAGVIGAHALPHLIGGFIDLIAGFFGLVFCTVVAVTTSVLGLLLGGLGVIFGLSFGLIPVLIPLGVLALPFVLIALLIRALAAR